MRGVSEYAALREKGIVIITFSPGAQRPLAAKGMDFLLLRALPPHKGEAAGKFEALLSACQIVNERLMCLSSVYSLCKNNKADNDDWGRNQRE